MQQTWEYENIKANFAVNSLVVSATILTCRNAFDEHVMHSRKPRKGKGPRKRKGKKDKRN